MGHGTYESTHNNIIESGTKLFLECGYERTNLRELCKEAGITTGAFYRHFNSKEDLFSALVKPVVDAMYTMFSDTQANSEEFIRDIRIEEFWQFSDEVAGKFVTFIYDNFVSFKLLLQCADGTPYSSFITDLTDMEVKSTVKIFEVMRKKGLPVNELCTRELHMLSHAYISSIMECVMHDYTKEETLKYTKTICDFFSAGWKKVFGL